MGLDALFLIHHFHEIKTKKAASQGLWLKRADLVQIPGLRELPPEVHYD